MKIFLLGVLAIIILGVAGFVLSLNKTQEEETNQPIQQQEETVLPTELKIEDILVGEGKEAISGKLLSMHYTGTLLDGTKFDSSLDRGAPFEFVLGTGQVIQGWDQGIAGMKVGGKRILTIPPDLAYGASAGHRLQNETLIFEVELLEVKDQ